MSFVHLHAHTEYSMLDGASRIGDMFAAAAAADMPACAITDHGVMYGVLDFYARGKSHGVKPILGMEGYLFPGHRSEKPKMRDVREGEEAGIYHVTLLAADQAGYHNLVKISSKAWLEGFHYKPRADHELLQEYSEGLICLSGCMSAEIPKKILAGDMKGAREKAAQYRSIFGDRFYLELQDHGIPSQGPLNDELVAIGREMGIPWVATNDSHYVHKDDATAHDVLLCINTNSLVSETNRFKFDSDEFYLKSPEEMQRAFARWPGACENTLEVADRCNVDIELGKTLLPHYEVPEGETLATYLEKLVVEGLKRRRGGEFDDTAMTRVRYELDVIGAMGFDGYFLVVQDFVNWAKRNDIRVGPGRGSAAGSIVSYALGITELDPIRYDLMFERFLNPERRSMPDIDIDFDERRRGDVIRYVSEKYGEERVAQIITYGTIKGKQAIKDAARVLGFPYSEGDKLTRMYPPLVFGRDEGLAKALETSVELREAYEGGGDAKKIIDTALKIENIKRSAGIHAAGVVIGRDPLIEHVPLKRGDHGEVVTQFDKDAVEELGLLKMDFLGLRNLTVIELAREYIRNNRGVEVDVDNLDFEDPKVYEMLQRGDTDGVFQLESDGMRRYLAQLKPNRFEHIMAMVALYRPGPMDQIPAYIERMHDASKIGYLHPALEGMTQETYGILVYQEQIVIALQKIAGYTAGEADLIRKAIGKKKRDVMAAEKPRFIKGCADGGVGQRDAEHLWGLIERFADYSFNRAHAACYAYVAYQTAWLKVHYPIEYVAALLTSVKDRKDDKPKYLTMARKMGIDVLIPDVNSSETDFTPTGDAIRYGLSAVRGVGEGVVTRIVEAREEGKFVNFHDFVRRVHLDCLNRKTIESLIKAGAFDSLGHARRGLLDVFEDICNEIRDRRVKEAQGQVNLFEELLNADGTHDHDVPIPIEEHRKEVLLAQEKEALGRYVSDHPLLGVEGLLGRMTDCSIGGLPQRAAGEVVTIGGLVAGLDKRMTRRGDIMFELTIEDVAGTAVNVVIFPKNVDQFAPYLRLDAVLLVKGRIDRDARDDSVKLMAIEMREPDLGKDRPFEIYMPAEVCTGKLVESLKGVLSSHPGSTQVFLHLGRDRGSTTVLRLGSEFCVDTSNGLHAEIKALLGPSAFTVA